MIGYPDHGKALLARVMARLAAAGVDLEACGGCRGRGEVGGFVNADSGYQTEVCPICRGTGKAPLTDITSSTRTP